MAQAIQRWAVVTGGAGFLGSHICGALLERGYDVVCIDDYCTGTAGNIQHLQGKPSFRIMEADINEADLGSRFLLTSTSEALRRQVYTTGDGGFRTDGLEWSEFAPRRDAAEDWTSDHADLACSAQRVLEDVLLDLARWLHGRTGDRLAIGPFAVRRDAFGSRENKNTEGGVA